LDAVARDRPGCRFVADRRAGQSAGCIQGGGQGKAGIDRRVATPGGDIVEK